MRRGILVLYYSMRVVSRLGCGFGVLLLASFILVAYYNYSYVRRLGPFWPTWPGYGHVRVDRAIWRLWKPRMGRVNHTAQGDNILLSLSLIFSKLFRSILNDLYCCCQFWKVVLEVLNLPLLRRHLQRRHGNFWCHNLFCCYFNFILFRILLFAEIYS